VKNVKDEKTCPQETPYIILTQEILVTKYLGYIHSIFQNKFGIFTKIGLKKSKKA
jgi:hypothetical protein